MDVCLKDEVRTARKEYRCDAYAWWVECSMSTDTEKTLCWHCSEPYPIGDESCPACNATNANVNPEQAQAEAKGGGNVDHVWMFQDDSFDHAFGTERVHYFACANCEATRPVEAGDFDEF